jgi:hypothetical protein
MCVLVVLVLGLVTCVVLRCGLVMVVCVVMLVCGVLMVCIWLAIMPPGCSSS